MPAIANEPSAHAQLRDKAEAQLQAGVSASRWSLGVDALRLLHRLSSTPDNAEDALKLLHELQVHQVELELQHEEIASNEQTLAEDLSLYRTLYDAAPIGYFLVDVEGDVIQGNHAAAELFNVGRDDLERRPIATLLAPESRSALQDLLKRVAQNGARDGCIAKTRDGEQAARHVHFLASMPPQGEHLLLACCECASADNRG
ncbi:MAG: PAS domain-containing protein [Halomonas sp.]|uniref:PAS domain-containing protein n=1 Tax=Halomonas sp. TaxID=1486246 RepID=UPI0039706D93